MRGNRGETQYSFQPPYSVASEKKSKLRTSSKKVKRKSQLYESLRHLGIKKIRNLLVLRLQLVFDFWVIQDDSLVFKK